MKFLQPFGEFILEAKRGKKYGLEKFLWIAENIGTWISQDIHSRVSPTTGKLSTTAVEKIPYLYKQDFNFSSLPKGETVISIEDYMKEHFSSVAFRTAEDKIAAIELYLGDYLNYVNDDLSHDFIAKCKNIFPLVKSEILNYGKPKSDTPSTGKHRGRKPGSRNKPKDQVALGPLDKIIKREKPAETEVRPRRTPSWSTTTTGLELDEFPGGYDKLKYQYK
jgi:hypothetical protein